MKIGYDAKRAFLNITGLGNYSRYVINGMAEMYPESSYHLYTPGMGSPYYDPPENTIIELPRGRWSKQLSSYWRTYGLPKRLKKDGIALYHGLSNEIPFGIENSGIRSVVTIHDLIFLRMPHLYPPVDRRIYFKKVKHAVEKANLIIAISEQTRTDLVELLNADQKKIRIAYQGCHPWFYKTLNDQKLNTTREKYDLPDEYMLYVGTMEERKGLLKILEAMQKKNIDLPLVAIGGKTDYFKKVEAFKERYNMHHVHFLHEIHNYELPAIYQQAKMFLLPSSYEGFGIPVLEAINSGIPVITSRGGCLEEATGKGGLFIDPANSDELGEAILRLMSDSSLCQKLIQEGAKHKMKFREQNTLPQIQKIYEECMR